MAKRTGSGSLIDAPPAPPAMPPPQPLPAAHAAPENTAARDCASAIAGLLVKHEDGLSFTALRTALQMERDELREGLEHGLKAGQIRRTGAGHDILYLANAPSA